MARRTQRGFTIIEVLVAVVVSAIGFAAIFSLQISTMQANMSAREMVAATNLAEWAIEQMRRESYLWIETATPPVEAGLLQDTNDDYQQINVARLDHNGLRSGGNESDLFRQRFCLYRRVGAAGAPGGVFEGILEAEVLVAWPRAAQDAVGPDCGEFQRNVALSFEITVPTTLRRHPRTGT